MKKAVKEYPICYLTPNNFSHKAGDGMKTRKRMLRIFIRHCLQIQEVHSRRIF